MKTSLISLAVVIALAVMGAGGFLIGYQQYEKSLLNSSRSPARLEIQIAHLEMEKQTLQRQVGDLQDQVKAGIKTQAEASRAVAALEEAMVEQKRELEEARVKLRKVSEPATEE